MRQSPKLRPTLWDGLVALTVIAAALALTLSLRSGDSGDLTAVISQGGQVQETVRLSALTSPEERTVTAGGYTLRLTLSPDGAEIAESDCPTQDCVHTGKITRPGQSIVCLPARLSVVLEGAGSGDIDVVLG